MKKLLGLGLLLFGIFAHNISAQTELAPCGTIFTEADRANYFAIPYQDRVNFTASEAEQKIPMKIHYFATSNPENIFPIYELQNALCELNRAFDTIGFTFYWQGDINYISGNIVSTFGDANVMASTHNVPNVINVYIGNISGTGACGFAWYPNSGPTSGGANARGGMFLAPGCITGTSKTWAHEMGHYLNLPHPFDQTSNNPTSISAERVTRTTEISPRLSANCQTAGDGFCDTDADYLDFRYNCNFPVTQLDINGDLFQVNKALIMGYAADNCVDEFTQQQKSMMNYALNVLRPYLLNQNPAMNIEVTTSPDLQFPIDSSNNNAPNFLHFRWKPVLGATHYVVQASRFPSLALTFGFDTTVTDTQVFYLGNRLSPNAQVYWRVKAYNAISYCSTFSPISFFYTSSITSNASFEANDTKVILYPTLLADGNRTLKLDFIDLLSQNTKITVTDLQGKMVINLAVPQNVANFQFDLPNVKPGMYFVRIAGTKILQTEKIMVK